MHRGEPQRCRRNICVRFNRATDLFQVRHIVLTAPAVQDQVHTNNNAPAAKQAPARFVVLE
jgi:hypothetical protein